VFIPCQPYLLLNDDFIRYFPNDQIALPDGITIPVWAAVDRKSPSYEAAANMADLVMM
jgi:hypothetical protein